MTKEERAKDLVVFTHVDTYKSKKEIRAIEVWHCYILGNEKWLFALSIDGLLSDYYYEVTYNKLKNEFYVDQYEKMFNRCFSNPD